MYIMCIGPTLLNTLYTCYSCIKMCVYFDGATLLHSHSIESITFQRSFDRTLNTLPFNLLEHNNASNKKSNFFISYQSNACEALRTYEHCMVLTRSHFTFIHTDTLIVYYKQSHIPTPGNNMNTFCNFYTTFFASHTTLHSHNYL